MVERKGSVRLGLHQSKATQHRVAADSPPLRAGERLDTTVIPKKELTMGDVCVHNTIHKGRMEP